MKTDFTTVLGIDGWYQHQLVEVIPNWRKHRPEIFKNPIVLFYDPTSLENPEVFKTLLGSTCSLVEWKPEDKFLSQRYRMLAGHLAVPAKHVETDWYVKIDVDSFAVDSGGPWIDRKWFQPDVQWVASPWGYTKPANQMEFLDEWANRNTTLSKFEPLAIPYKADSRLVRHRRMISKVMFARTEFSRWAFDLYAGNVPPVASQDGFHFYVSKRAGLKFITDRMSKRGWRSASSLRSLKRKLKELK